MLSEYGQRAWRRHPLRTSVRIAESLVRRRIERLRIPIVAYDSGRAKIRAPLNTALGLLLFRYGIDDPDVSLVRRLLEPDDTFVDAGANIGLFTLAAASKVGARGRVLAFEPASTTRKNLQANLDLNPFPWVEVRSEALSHTEGTLELTVFEGNVAGLTSFQPGRPGGRIERVNVTTLDEACHNARLPSVIKLDIEGAEHSALLGCQKILSQKKTAFFLELENDHLVRQGASAQMVVDLFRTHGYELFGVGKNEAGDEVIGPSEGVPPIGATPNVLAIADRSRLARAGVRITR